MTKNYNFNDFILPSNTKLTSKLNWTDFTPIIGEVFRIISKSSSKEDKKSANDIIQDVANKTHIANGNKEDLVDILENLFTFNGKTKVVSPQFLSLIEQNEEPSEKSKDKLISQAIASLIQNYSDQIPVDKHHENLDPLSKAYLNEYKASITEKDKRKYEKQPIFIPYPETPIYKYFVFDILTVLKSWDHDKSLLQLNFLFKFYLFQHISLTFSRLHKICTSFDLQLKTAEQIFWSLDTEKVAQSRKCVTNGYRSIEPAIDKISFHHLLLSVINEFAPGKSYETLSEEDLKSLSMTLLEHNKEYVLDSSNLTNLFHSFIHSFEIAEKGKRDAALKKPIQAWKTFITRNFTRSGGPVGRILIIREEEILLFAKLATKNLDGNKMHINMFWQELTHRGLWFDPQTKTAIIKYLDSVGLLESLSDSGDAKYVRKII